MTVKSDDDGNVDLADLKEKVEKYKDNLGAFMVTHSCIISLLGLIMVVIFRAYVAADHVPVHIRQVRGGRA